MPYTRVSDGSPADDSEALDGRGCLRDGYRASFSVTIVDGMKTVRVPHRFQDAASSTCTLTDAEQRFADSPAGQAEIAKRRRQFEASQAYKGRSARQWTDAVQADVVRALVTLDARMRVADAATTAAMADAASVQRAALETANMQRRNAIRDGWKG